VGHVEYGRLPSAYRKHPVSKKILTAIGTPNDDIARTPSKGQKSFNSLIAKIGKRRAALADWEAFEPEFRRKFADELTPLEDSFDAVRLEMVRRLDQSHDIKGLTQTERQTIEDLIIHMAAPLLEHTEDPDLAEIFERYSVLDPEEEWVALETMRQTMEDALGIEISDDVDMASPEAVIRHVQEQLDQQEERERKRREAREEHHAKRKKTPKNVAAEDQARTEQEEIHLSIREVYRKLASALHPDREPDPVERERKAALMQRVNKAYATRSLLDLLELQLELEHIDQATLDNISEVRLKRWNTILKEQLRGLDQELMEVEADYHYKCDMSPMQAVSPKSVKRSLNERMAAIREGIKRFEQDLRVIGDIKRMKPWLKEMKRELVYLQQDDDMPFY
jgi:hypothetical protein